MVGAKGVASRMTHLSLHTCPPGHDFLPKYLLLLLLLQQKQEEPKERGICREDCCWV